MNDPEVQVTIEELEEAEEWLRERGHSVTVNRVMVQMGKTRPSAVADFAHNRVDMAFDSTTYIDITKYESKETLEKVVDSLSLQLSHNVKRQLSTMK